MCCRRGAVPVISGEGVSCKQHVAYTSKIADARVYSISNRLLSGLD